MGTLEVVRGVYQKNPIRGVTGGGDKFFFKQKISAVGRSFRQKAEIFEKCLIKKFAPLPERKYFLPSRLSGKIFPP